MKNTIKNYSVRQVANWLETLGMPSKAFVDQHIDGGVLYTLSGKTAILEERMICAAGPSRRYRSQHSFH